MSRAIAVLMLLRLLCGAQVAPGPHAARKVAGKPTRLLFAGDILLARQVAVELHFRRTSPWQGLAPLFHQADWVAGNLEGAVGSPAQCPPQAGTPAELDRNPCFAVAAKWVPLMRQAGFTAIGTANNHSGDLGAQGRRATRAALRQAGLTPLDFAHSPVFFQAGATRLAVVALSLVPARDRPATPLPSVALARKLRLAHALSNLVVVYVHWGVELHDWPSRQQQRQAAWLIVHGADLIVGSHPHVIEEPECVLGHPVFFSLGNHLFDQKYPETRRGQLADCRVEQNQLRCGGLDTMAGPGDFYPRLAGRDAVADRRLASCAVALHAPLTVDHFEFEAGNRHPGGRRLMALRDGHVAWTTTGDSLLAIGKGRLNGSGKPAMLFTLERHPSPLDSRDAVRPYVYAVQEDGLVARWRGSALAWPLLDARLLPGAAGVLCALHRGDSFLVPDPKTKKVRFAVYQWNGFGFSGLRNQGMLRKCEQLIGDEAPEKAVRPRRKCWPLPSVAAVVLRSPARDARSAQGISKSPPTE